MLYYIVDIAMRGLTLQGFARFSRTQFSERFYLIFNVF
jgi:hypothetical protein